MAIKKKIGHEEVHSTLLQHVEEVMHLRKAVNKLTRTHKASKDAVKRFNWDDFFQQIVGALIVSLPFSATEEVWMLAKTLSPLHIMMLVLLMLAFDVIITRFTKYQNVKSKNFLGIPLRVISLIFVSYGVNLIVLTTLGVLGPEHVNNLVWGTKLVLLMGFFSSIGAGAADIVR